MVAGGPMVGRDTSGGAAEDESRRRQAEPHYVSERVRAGRSV